MNNFLKKFSVILILLIVLKGSVCNALRIVSLAPYVTEALILLGAEENLVAVTNFCQEKFNLDKEVIGDSLNINIEKVLFLKPDIIFITAMNKMEQVGKLKRFGIGIKYYPYANNFKDSCRNFLELAKLVGKERRAIKIIEKVSAKLEGLKLVLKSEEDFTVFIQVGYSPLITAGSNCYLNEIIRLAKGKNVAENYGQGFFRISREKVIESDPEAILILTMEEKEYQYDWRKFKYLRAVRENKIYTLDSDIFSRPNPASFVKAVYLLSKILHPEVFKNEN